LAGESAGEVARRLRKQAARLERSAANWERGAEGEASTAAALGALSARGWTTFHDVRWPGRQRANIDHVAVGPAGVFVIDSKNWSGDVRVTDGVLWQGGRRREREVAAVAEAALAVSQLLQGLAATPVLCFVREEPLEGWAHDVMVCSPQNLAERLAVLPPMLGPASIARVNTILRAQLAPADQPTTRRRGAVRADVLPPPRPTPVRRRRGRRSGGSLRRTKVITLLQGLVLTAAIAVGAPLLLPKIAAHAPELLGLAPVHADFDQAVDLHGSSVRPTMSLAASTPVVVSRRHVRGTLGPGMHAVGVRIHVANESAMSWTSPRLVVTAHDAHGHALGRVDLRRGKKTPALPGVIQLRPGSEIDGYVAFAVPRRAHVAELALRLGPSAYELVRWSAPAK
jgi:hypothetical protein